MSVIDKYAPLVKKNFTRPLAPWMKDIKINKQNKQKLIHYLINGRDNKQFQ